MRRQAEDRWKAGSRATSAEHGVILEKLGAEVVYPERDMAIRLASRLETARMLDIVQLSEKINVMKMEIPAQAIGKTVLEVNFRARFDLNIIAIENGGKLVEVIKPVEYNSNISMEKLVVERLIAGPDAENEELYPVINPATKVLGVTVKDGTCYVNLDNGFLTQTYNVSAEVQIYSIVNSLVELSNINKVQIAVNGNTDMIFREKISLSNVFDRNLDLVYETEELQS